MEPFATSHVVKDLAFIRVVMAFLAQFCFVPNQKTIVRHTICEISSNQAAS